MQLVDGRWQISGHDVQALSEQHGTPLYLYDSQAIRRQVKRFREAFSAFQQHRISELQHRIGRLHAKDAEVIRSVTGR